MMLGTTNIKFSLFLLEKLAVSRLTKKFPTFYVTPMFITALTTARHLSLSQATAVMFRSVPSSHFKNYNTVPSASTFSKWSLSFRFPHQAPYCSSLHT